MIPATCQYCSKTESAHARLLKHIELPPGKGDRGTGILPKLNTEESPKQKWRELLLRIKANMHELRLRPKKSPYRLRPIIRMALKVRLQQKVQQKEQKTTN